MGLARSTLASNNFSMGALGNKPPQVFGGTYNSLVVRIHGLYSPPLGQVGGLVLVWTDGTFPLPLEVFPQVPGKPD